MKNLIISIVLLLLTGQIYANGDGFLKHKDRTNEELLNDVLNDPQSNFIINAHIEAVNKSIRNQGKSYVISRNNYTYLINHTDKTQGSVLIAAGITKFENHYITPSGEVVAFDESINPNLCYGTFTDEMVQVKLALWDKWLCANSANSYPTIIPFTPPPPQVPEHQTKTFWGDKTSECGYYETRVSEVSSSLTMIYYIWVHQDCQQEEGTEEQVMIVNEFNQMTWVPMFQAPMGARIMGHRYSHREHSSMQHQERDYHQSRGYHQQRQQPQRQRQYNPPKNQYHGGGSPGRDAYNGGGSTGRGAFNAKGSTGKGAYNAGASPGRGAYNGRGSTGRGAF